MRDLRSSAFVASFESTDLTTYRATLERALVATIASIQSKEQDGWCQYSSSLFETVLYNGIPWSELVAHDHRQTERGLSIATTPLEEVVGMLSNPCLVPHAFTSSIASVYLRVLVDQKSQRLLQAFLHLIDKRPQLESWMLGFVQSNMFVLKAAAVESYDVGRVHRLVSVLKHLKSSTSLKCLCVLLQNIDSVDVTLLELCKKHKKRPREVSCSCQHVSKSTRRPRVASVLSLHDEVDGQEDDRSGGTVERMAPINHAASCQICRHPTSPDITQLPVGLVVLRSRLYRKIASVFSVLCMQVTEKALSRGQRCVGPTTLQSIVHLACQHPESASLRLCVVILADAFKRYQSVVDYLWRLCIRRQSLFGTTVLKVYAEFLVECAYFDCPTNCWVALHPLVKHAIHVCNSQMLLEADASSQIPAADNTDIRHVLRCFSYILCRRRHVLADTIENDRMWRELVTKLSLVFSDAKWWISQDMTVHERQETLRTLQAVGIVGFLEAFDMSNEDCWESSTKTTAWPYTKIVGIRAAHRRMGPNVTREDLLSKHAIPKRIRASPKSVIRGRNESDDRLVGAPIMSYLNDDVLKIVFSFLGYKRLVRASGICKTWRALAEDDSLWAQAYSSRFGIREDDKDAAACITRGESRLGSWKMVFTGKALAEKELRFKRHSSGWKHRTCEYIGCLMVIRSPGQLTRHYGTHKPRKPKRHAKSEGKARVVSKHGKLQSLKQCRVKLLG